MKGCVLIIAGSDSGGGAGIQGDLKTVAALGGYGATAITAITAQNTLGVTDIHPIPHEVVAAQMHAVLDDIGVGALKTGMLHDARMIETVAAVMDEKAKNIPRVIDPVMIAKSGAPLLFKEAVEALKAILLPRADVLTPNLPEAEALLGTSIYGLDVMREAAVALGALGPKAVLLKGGHGTGNVLHDVLWDGHVCHVFESVRLHTSHTHGTGCTLASAIATSLAQGFPLYDAVRRARSYVFGAIQNAPGYGKGHGPLNHGWMG